MEAVLKKAREEHDSLGGIVEVRVQGCPPGLGEPVFDKLDADLARAVMSVGAVKGMEIGAGFAAARLSGSENNDPLTPEGFRTNHAGGILGGISSGDEIVLRAAVKPIPSIKREQDTITREGEAVKLHLEGRHRYFGCPPGGPGLGSDDTDRPGGSPAALSGREMRNLFFDRGQERITTDRG